MKISREWLQTYFDSPLPDAQALADALTFHAFEIESVEDNVLDVKVTPNRGHDCLSHRSIAKELSAILNMPLKNDPLRERVSLEPKTDIVKVTIEDPKLSSRFTGAYIKGVRVGPSPEWLRERLEAVGQKSINNVVDATNFVMFDIGQPLHAFDVGKLQQKSNASALNIRLAKKGEKLMGLDDKEYALTPSMLVIEDANAKSVVSIAGIKGGKPTGIDSATADIFIEAANWDGVTIRKTSQALKLRTDASDRFQQVISPELAAYGTLAAAKLITEVAGGELIGFVDEYPSPQKSWSVSVSTAKINKVLGTELRGEQVADVFSRLSLENGRQGDTFTVDVPFERLDLTIPEDLIEEVARVVGYDKIPSVELPSFPKKPEVNVNFYAAEKTREKLIAKGYSEVFTSVFAEKGERAVANKVGGEKPYLRTTLVDSLRDAYERNARNRDLLGLKEIRIFEIGTVWNGGKEVIMLGTADSAGVREEPLRISGDRISRYEELPTSTTERYEPFSKYPFIVRDISMWVPQGPEAISEVLAIFGEESEGLLRHVELFDQFKKPARPDDAGRSGGGERISYAFHLVLQSFEKTLTDEEANSVMEKIHSAVTKRGWEVR
ncbi:phenylalanine--tRNA ligase subunit beta [Candidatus Kaiserbacteria bacterium]|nr:phenylalanine--tRNA ligase subunit beta [Candidatus Kaiserbacteria bacterium]